MTRDECKELLMVLQIKFPNFKVAPEKASYTVNAWYEDLAPYSYDDVKRAMAAYRDTANTAFAPSTSQIIGYLRNLTTSEMNGSEAWSLVHEAICGSRYGMDETFSKLPPAIQRAVGSPRILLEWSELETEEIHNSIHPRFLRSYEAAVKENTIKPYMAAEVRTSLEDKVYKFIPQIAPPVEEGGMSEETERKLKELYKELQ